MYVTVDELRAVLAKDPANPAGTAAALPEAKLTEAIESAQAEVDAKLSGRYSVPLKEPFPALLVDITRDIAAFLASLVQRQNVDFSGERDPILLRYQRAVKLLDGIAAGSIDLPPGTEQPDSGGAGVLRGIQPYRGDLFAMGDFGLGVDGGGNVRPTHR